MPELGSITQLICRFKDGDDLALIELYRRCWPDLVRRARATLGRRLADADEEDIAQEALLAFCKGMQAGKLPDLENRGQFKAFMTTVIANNAINRIDKLRTAKRGGGNVISLTPLQSLVQDMEAQSVCEDASSEFYEHYVSRLPEDLRKLANMYLLDMTHDAIGTELNCARRTVIRRLNRLREEWLRIAAESGDV